MTDIQTGERKQMELKEKLQALLELEGFPCRFMEPMSSHTTFRIGGPAAAYVCPSGETELKTVLSFCRREKLPFSFWEMEATCWSVMQDMREWLFPRQRG